MFSGRTIRLNAPYGARCFLTNDTPAHSDYLRSLNAPYGARCFLTSVTVNDTPQVRVRLNAPYGARCFLTKNNT